MKENLHTENTELSWSNIVIQCDVKYVVKVKFYDAIIL